MTKRLISLIMALVIVLGAMTAVSANAASADPAKTSASTGSISLDKTAITIEVGGTAVLSLNNAVIYKIKWSSSNTGVATVGTSLGIIQGVKAGVCIITAEYEGKKYYCTVTVKAKQINVTNKSLTLYVGDTHTYTYDGSSTIKWASNNTKVATVSSKGVIKAVSPGRAAVVAVYGNNKFVCTVTVKARQVNITQKSITLYVGNTKTYNYSGSYTIKWASNNTKVATVSSKGVIKAISPGRAAVVAVYGNNKFVCTVTVKAKQVIVTQKSVTLHVGGTHTFTYNGPYTIKWASNNTKVATVSSKGVIKAVSPGRAAVVAIYGNNKLVCTVTVKARPVKVTKKSITLKVGSTRTYTYSGSSKIKWASNNTKVATVSSKGVIKGISPGKALVVAIYGYNKFICTVTVYNVNRSPKAIDSGGSGSSSSGGSGSNNSGICSACGGLGNCIKCLGSGDCDHCHGRRTQVCNYCSGGRCGACSGKGYIYKGVGISFGKYNCPTCRGTGRCRTCGGTSRSSCIFCRGTGRCDFCSGSGRCGSCHGTGRK